MDKVTEELIKSVQEQNKILAYMASGGDPQKILDAQKAVVTHISGPGSLFGGGGIFSTPGLEPDVISAYVSPQPGLMSLLEWYPSVFDQPRFGTITGFTGETGANPTNPCDNPPHAYMKGCNLTAQFGRLSRATNTIEFDKVMRELHAGITTELMLRGRLLGLGNISPAGLSEPDVLNIYTMAEMVTVGALLERLLTNHLWQGNPANNTAGGGYMEFPGLTRQVATGQLDADTGTACPALDSDVKDFNYQDVCGTTPDIVNYLSTLEFYLRYNAQNMGLMPVRWAIAMRPDLWQVLSECYPCAYNTNRCSNAVVGGSVTIDGREMTLERDRMRQSMTIDINGYTYPVVTDIGIPEQTNIEDGNVPAGCYASSIFMIPLSIVGNFPVTYMEHVNYQAGARDVSLLQGKEVFWTDRGRYSWALDSQLWCYELVAKIEPRVVLRTPQLAGRIDHVGYCPLQHTRVSDPSSPYFFDGGVSIRATPSVHAVWLP